MSCTDLLHSVTSNRLTYQVIDTVSDATRAAGFLIPVLLVGIILAWVLREIDLI